MFETLLSVIIPVYNVEPYLEQCLDSVINQTYKNMEIICINDGSTDNSLKILEKYKLKDKRIKIISQENKGLSEARNVGLKIAKGKYIGFVDSDDFIDPTMYEKLVTPMIKDPSIDFSVANSKCVSEDGVYKGIVLNGSIEKEEKSKVILFSPIYQMVVWNKVYKKALIQERKIEFPKGLFSEDLSFTPAYLVNSNYVYCTPERLYNYRIRDNSTCGQANSPKYESRKIDTFKVHLYLYNYLKNSNLFNANREFLQKSLSNNVQSLAFSELKTFKGKWLFIKEFWKFLDESDYPIIGKISLTWTLTKNLLLWCCYRLTN